MIETSVIVPFKNAQATLDSCLRSLSCQTYRSFEMILVDNNSTDDSRRRVDEFCRQAVERLPVRVITELRPGAAAARNRGAAEARGVFLAFTDADCVAGKNWLSEILPAFNDGRVGAVAGNIHGFPAANCIDGFHNLFTLQGRSDDQIHDRFSLTSGGFPSANLVMRRSVFEKVGGFDESIKIYGEDYDLCARVYAAGYLIKALCRGEVRHIHRRGLWKTWRQAYSFGKAHGLLLARHLPRHFIVDLGRLSFRGVESPVCGWLNLSSADKKLLGLLMLPGWHGAFWGLPPLFMAYLALMIIRRARSHGQKCSLSEAAIMAGVLIWKSAAMTMGRLAGSAQYGVVCF
jgi:GT2 family glycosyltransferase